MLDRLQQVDDYVRGCTWQLKKILKLSEDYKMSWVSSNTDGLQQVDDYVRGCTWQLKKIKTIWRL
jgi:hypothetical protein